MYMKYSCIDDEAKPIAITKQLQLRATMFKSFVFCNDLGDVLNDLRHKS